MSLSKGSKIFVYGTLRPDASSWGIIGNGAKATEGGGTPTESRAKVLGRASLQGAVLYDINGGFPGLVVTDNPDDVVRGYCLEITDHSLPAALDRYEGYPMLYDRREVTLVDGTLAWVYTFNYPTDKYSIVEGGDWIDYLAVRDAA